MWDSGWIQRGQSTHIAINCKGKRGKSKYRFCNEKWRRSEEDKKRKKNQKKLNCESTYVVSVQVCTHQSEWKIEIVDQNQLIHHIRNNERLESWIILDWANFFKNYKKNIRNITSGLNHLNLKDVKWAKKISKSLLQSINGAVFLRATPLLVRKSVCMYLRLISTVFHTAVSLVTPTS